MSITIKDIAKLANVSHTTVSRALNNSPLINEDTKNRIKAIAEELHYVPNYSAKSLVLDKSYTIGIFFSSIRQGVCPSFFYETIKGVNTVIGENYNLVVRGIDSYEDFSTINNKRFDGIILMSQSDNDNPFIYHVIKQGIPLVVLDREVDDKNLINVLSDDEEGAFKIIEYLIKMGHNNIGIIEGKSEFKSDHKRKNGFLKALIEYKLPINSDYMIEGSCDMESGYENMKKLISLPDYPTAVFCSNDDIAIGAIKAAFDKGLKIPQDISIVGFDDIEYSGYTTPSLTTVKRPIEETGILGAKKLIEAINNKIYTGEKVKIENKIILRDSVLDLSNK